MRVRHLQARARNSSGKTVGIAGEHLTGAEMAAAMTRGVGEEVRYNDVPPEVYRGFGFPGADDLGNMFQFKRDFNDYFRGRADLGSPGRSTRSCRRSTSG